MESVFELGDVPPDVGLAPNLVVVEADGTYLPAQREEGDRFEVKTGVFHTGKGRAGGRRHRRFTLLNKGATPPPETPTPSARASPPEGSTGSGCTERATCCASTTGWMSTGRASGTGFPGALHQIDHLHVAERMCGSAGPTPRSSRS